MIKLKPNREYNFRLMPGNCNNHIQMVKVCVESNHRPFILHKYFTVVLTNDDKLDVLVFGKQINNFIQSVYNGYCGTSEGYFLLSHTSTEIDHYYGTSDKSYLNIYESEDYLQYTDVVLYEPCILHDLSSERILSFRTRTTQNLLDIYNVGTINSEPLINSVKYNELINSCLTDDLIQNAITEFKQMYLDLAAPHIVHFDDAAVKYYQESLLIKL